jgi:hypothetical protein
MIINFVVLLFRVVDPSVVDPKQFVSDPDQIFVKVLDSDPDPLTGKKLRIQFRIRP